MTSVKDMVSSRGEMAVFMTDNGVTESNMVVECLSKTKELEESVFGRMAAMLNG